MTAKLFSKFNSEYNVLRAGSGCKLTVSQKRDLPERSSQLCELIKMCFNSRGERRTEVDLSNTSAAWLLKKNWILGFIKNDFLNDNDAGGIVQGMTSNNGEWYSLFFYG